jgi:hypothetical protein
MSRQPVLDEVKRGQIIALASSGFSRRSIARYVGCAAATIENTAERLPDFAEQLGEAERKFVQTHSDNIARHAANSWRASAWLMQHLQPEEFARLSTKAPTPAQNASQFAVWSRELLAAVPVHMRGAVQRVTSDMLANLRNGNSNLAADPQTSIPTDPSTEHPPGDHTPLQLALQRALQPPPKPPVTAPYRATPHLATPYPAQSPLRINNADPRAVARLFKLIQTMLAEKLSFQAIDVFCEATGVAEQVASAAVSAIAQNHPEHAVLVAGLADPRSIQPASAPAPAAQPAEQPAERAGVAPINTPPGGVMHGSKPPDVSLAAPPASTAIPMAAPVPSAIQIAAPASTGIPMAAPNSWPAASSALLLLLAFFLGGLTFHAQSEHFPLDVPPVPLNNSPVPVDPAPGHLAWPEQQIGRLVGCFASHLAPGQLAWPEQQIGRLGRAHYQTAAPGSRNLPHMPPASLPGRSSRLPGWRAHRQTAPPSPRIFRSRGASQRGGDSVEPSLGSRQTGLHRGEPGWGVRAC